MHTRFSFLAICVFHALLLIIIQEKNNKKINYTSYNAAVQYSNRGRAYDVM